MASKLFSFSLAATAFGRGRGCLGSVPVTSRVNRWKSERSSSRNRWERWKRSSMIWNEERRISAWFFERWDITVSCVARIQASEDLGILEDVICVYFKVAQIIKKGWVGWSHWPHTCIVFWVSSASLGWEKVNLSVWASLWWSWAPLASPRPYW